MEGGVEEETKIASSSSKRIDPSPNWSQLHPELLHLISQKLTLIFDYISFRSVCSPWRSAAKPSDLPPQPPLFILPDDPGLDLDDDDDDALQFFSLSNNKLYQFRLPYASEKRCFGSNHGWLLVLGTDPSVFLLNPFTMSQIQLPPLTTVPGYRRHKSWVEMRDGLIIQAVISSNPSSDDDDCVVMVALCDSLKLAFCRPGGDKSWTAIDAGLRGRFGGLAYHDKKFYAIDGDGRVVACDVAVSPPKVKAIPSLKRAWDDQCYDRCCLVSSDVGLLLIVRYMHGGDEWDADDGNEFSDEEDEGDADGRKDFFEVFKMDVSEGKKPRWEMINTLDGEALFLCDSHGVAFKASEFPGIRPNCIYYSNPLYNFEEHNLDIVKEYNLDGHDVGVFSMEDTSIKMIHCYPDDSLDWSLSAWLRPSLS